MNKSDLIEELKSLLEVETLAKNNYEEDLLTFKNPKVKSLILKIKNDEIKHIRILNNLIQMLS